MCGIFSVLNLLNTEKSSASCILGLHLMTNDWINSNIGQITAVWTDMNHVINIVILITCGPRRLQGSTTSWIRRVNQTV